jgi:hypothetical protein
MRYKNSLVTYALTEINSNIEGVAKSVNSKRSLNPPALPNPKSSAVKVNHKPVEKAVARLDRAPNTTSSRKLVEPDMLE